MSIQIVFDIQTGRVIRRLSGYSHDTLILRNTKSIREQMQNVSTFIVTAT